VVKPLLIATVGLPRSGKSTILKKLAADLHAPIVKKDDIRLALHGQRYVPCAEDFVRAIAKVMIRSLFLSGSPIVIADETHYSRAARRHTEDPDWETQYLEVPTPPEVCKERAIATGQPDLIPIIDGMWERFEPLDEFDVRYVCRS
jgi:predicted kinase